MAITTNPTPGIEIQTAAKQSVEAGSAAALGSQGGAASDEVIVPDAIGSNNEGGLESTPSYVGRHFLLRPLTQLALGGGIAQGAVPAAAGSGYVVGEDLTVSGGTSNNAATYNVDAEGAISSTVAAGGTGYVVNDRLTVSGGAFTVASIFNVDTIGGSGDVTAVSLVNGGAYTTTPGNPATTSGGTGSSCTLTVTYGGVAVLSLLTTGDYTVTPSNPAATTASASGTGATLTVTYIDGEELRFVTAIATLTLTVNEDWMNIPVSGEDWAVSYILEDVAVVTGCTASAKTGVFECSRRVNVGDTSNTDFAFFGMAEGKGMEVDDVGSATAGLVITDGGYWAHGYLQGGVPINGGFVFAFNNTAAEDMIQFDDGGRAFMFDVSFASQLVDMEIITVVDTGAGSIREARKGKIFGASNNIDLDGWLLRELTIASGVAATNLIIITESSDIDGVTIINTQGLDSADDATTAEYTIRNPTFAGNARHVLVHDDKTWNFVNPIGWIADSTFISFEVDDLNFVNRLTSLASKVEQPDGTDIERALTLVFEGTINNNLPLANQQLTDATGDVTSDILEEQYTFPSSVFTTETFGDFAFRAFKYGFSPFVSSLVLADSPTGILSVTTLSTDAAIVATQPQAIEDGRGMEISRQVSLDYDGQTADFTVSTALRGLTSGATGDIYADTDAGGSGTLLLENVIGVFEDGEEVRDDNATEGIADVNLEATDIPFEVIEYDTGTGTIPAIGDRIQGQTSGAVGTIVQIFGDNTAGHMILRRRNETAFTTTGETIDDALESGAWTATHDQDTPGNHDRFDFHWLVDANSATTKTYTAIYEYLAALTSKRFHPIAVQDDGGVFTDFTDEAKDATATDVALFPATPAVEDAFYYGDQDTLFTSIHINVGTVMTGSPTIVLEYWNGSIWAALSGVSDGTADFTLGGMRIISWTIPTDWETIEPGNGITGYYVRSRITVLGTGTADADQIWTDRVFEDVHIWGEDEVSQLLFSGASGFFTNRNVALTDGVVIANFVGTTDFFTSDDGSTFTPPVARTLTITVLDDAAVPIETAQVRIEQDSDKSLISSGTTNASGVFSDSVFLSGDVDVDAVVRKSSPGSTRYIPVRRAATITSGGLSLTISMTEDTTAAP